MMFNPGGLGNMLAQQSGMPDDEFARSAEQSMLRTGKAPITMLADLARRITARKSAMTQQGLQAGAQMRSQPPTLKDQLELEALSLGIGSQPYGYAGGGLVAFQLGGKAEEDSLTLADIEDADLGDQMAFGFGFADPVAEAQALAGDELRVKSLPALRAAAFPPDAQELARQGRLIGIVVSPRDSEQVRAEKFQRIRDAIAAAKQRESQPRAEIPRELIQLPTDYQRRTDIPSGGIVSPGMARSATARSGAAPASTRPGAGTPGAGTGADAGTRPVVPSPAATASDIAEYLKQGQKNIEAMAGRGRVTPAELALREALLKAQEAEREPRVEYKEPEGLTTREKLQLASFDPTKGRWMGSLAEKAAGVMTAREAKAEEFRKLNREIDIANRRLNTALAQQRLAYATSDRQAQEAADLAVATAKLALREKAVEFGLKSRGESSKEKQADAAMKAAEQRGGAEDLNRQRLALQALRLDPNYKSIQENLVNAVKQSAVAPQNAELQAKLRKAQADAIALMRKHGVSPGEDSDLNTGPSTTPFDASKWKVEEIKKN